MKETMIFDKNETPFQSLASDFVTFGFLILCIWFSQSQGGGWWTFFTCGMFLLSLSVKTNMKGPRWVTLKTKKEALDWANSLPDDEVIS